MPRPNRGPRLADEPNEHGIYEVKWTELGRSKRVSTGETDYRAAQRFFVRWLPEHERVKDRAASGTLSTADVLDLYDAEHVTAKVVNKDTQRIAIAHLRAHFGAIDALAIEPRDVARYKQKRRRGEGTGRPVKDGSIRRELSALIAALNYAASQKKLRAADLPPIELPEASEPKDRWLTQDEAATLLVVAGSADRRIAMFIRIALETASRKRAIEQLTWFQVDLEANKITLNPRGRKQTRKRRPVVPISTTLRPLLVSAKEKAKTPYVLIHPGNTRKAFETACRRAGLDDVTPHTLRHTWATWAAQRGVPLWKIAGVLGDTYATVERNYLHHCPDHLRDAVDYHRGADTCDEQQQSSSPAS